MNKWFRDYWQFKLKSPNYTCPLPMNLYMIDPNALVSDLRDISECLKLKWDVANDLKQHVEGWEVFYSSDTGYGYHTRYGNYHIAFQTPEDLIYFKLKYLK